MTKAVRLTNGVRDAIAEKMVRAATEEAISAACEKENAAADVFLSAYLGKQEETFKSLPQSWLKKASNLSLNSPTGQRLNAYFSNPLQPVPETLTNWNWDYDFEQAHSDNRKAVKAYKAMIAAAAECADLRAKKRDMQTRIRAALSKISSGKALSESWPEAAKFLPESTKAVQLPAVPVSHLNAMLEKFPDEAKA